MSIKEVFNNSLQNCKYIFPNGKEAIFQGGVYLTDDVNEISHLNEEIALGHPHLFRDRDIAKRRVDSNDDPMSALRAQIIAEYETTKKANEANLDETKTVIAEPQTDKPQEVKDMGTSMSLEAIRARINMGNSNTVGAGAADSSSGATTAL